MPYEYKAKVLRVYDGDTFLADIDLGFGFSLKEKFIRLMGVDTPEIKTKDSEEKKFGELSKKFAETFFKNNKNEVVIKTHIHNVSLEGKEKFGRILAYVFDTSVNKCLNVEIIKNFHGVEYFGKSKEDIILSHIENRKKINLQNAS
jgi:micrococcal nuclease